MSDCMGIYSGYVFSAFPNDYELLEAFSDIPDLSAILGEGGSLGYGDAKKLAGVIVENDMFAWCNLKTSCTLDMSFSETHVDINRLSN